MQLVEYTPAMKMTKCRRRLEGHPLRISNKQDWGRGFILLLPQAAVLPDQVLETIVLSQHVGFRCPKPSDLGLHVVSDL